MAEFQEVMKQAKRMCGAQNDCEECPIFEECEGFGYISWECAADAEAVERKIMGWAAENPEPRYPSWGEWQKANFPASGNNICPAVYMPKSYCEGNCTACRKKPIPADIAEKLGVKPIGGDADA